MCDFINAWFFTSLTMKQHQYFTRVFYARDFELIMVTMEMRVLGYKYHDHYYSPLLPVGKQ